MDPQCRQYQPGQKPDRKDSARPTLNGEHPGHPHDQQDKRDQSRNAAEDAAYQHAELERFVGKPNNNRDRQSQKPHEVV